jgi:hypothetical protein
LKERKLGVRRPRLREKGGGEVAIPAYEAMQDAGLGGRMLDVLMRGISTRQYAEVLPEMASTCGVSKSNVSREAAEAGEEALQELLERRFDEVDLLVIYIDGMVFGDYHVISAVGVDAAGHKHVLGMQPGATENAAAVEDLLTQLVARGVKPEVQRLFVIDGAKALRTARSPRFRPAAPGAALPQSQDSQRGGTLARRAEGASEGGDACLLQADGERRDRPSEKTRRLAGPGTAGRCQQFAGRAGRMFHDQSSGSSAVAASLFGHDQLNRKPAVGCADANSACLSLARRGHDATLGGSIVSGDGEELPPHHGLEGSLATGRDPRKKSNRNCCG